MVERNETLKNSLYFGEKRGKCNDYSLTIKYKSILIVYPNLKKDWFESPDKFQYNVKEGR